MSRIDKAIELAAKMTTQEHIQQKPEAIKASAELAQQMSRVPLDTSNNLLVAANDPHGKVAEEFHKLHAKIEHLAASGDRKNTILITSAVSGEGKTITAANLALTMARTGENMVFLIDTDLRRPSLGKLLNIKSDAGLVACLRDNLPFERALVKASQGKLAVLPAGQKVEEPLELLSSNRMQRLLEEMKERYPDSYFLFDSPPVLPFADARVMGSLMDGTIFVARENYTRLNQLKEGLDNFVSCELLGVLFNDCSTHVKNKYGDYY